jgi:hypothetical protein
MLRIVSAVCRAGSPGNTLSYPTMLAVPDTKTAPFHAPNPTVARANDGLFGPYRSGYR